MYTPTILTFLTLAARALAGWNCKCQDSRGQFNKATKACCAEDPAWPITYYPGPNNQCANRFGGLDSGAFDSCCRAFGTESFCWK